MSRARITSLIVVCLLAASAAFASWYDDYDVGIAAAHKGQWAVVVQKMNAAIAGHDKESNNERTYGAIFISYHPHYYRGVAYLNLGKYEQAVTEFEKTSGPGGSDLGPTGRFERPTKHTPQPATPPTPHPP